MLVTCLLFSCNDNKASDNKSGTDSTKTGKIEDPVIAYLTPENIDLSTPIPVNLLKEAVTAWDSVKEVTITGYCNFFFDKGSVNDKTGITAGTESSQVLFDCTMAQEYPEEFDKTIPVTIKGKVSEVWGDKICLSECVLVSKGEENPANGKYIVPQTYKGENVNASDCYTSFFGWKDVELVVVGYYNSHTTSITDYGTTIRLDLSMESMGERMVGCELKQEPPANISENREGVQIKGKVEGIVFGNVQMIECEILNR